MKLSSSHVLALALLLGGCQVQSPTPLAASPEVASEWVSVPPSTSAPTGQVATQESAVSQGCYYVWATRELPELSASLQAELVETGIATAAGAYAFGEECRAESAAVTFLVMETDFRILVAVESLEDEGYLGNAILGAMTAIESLPADDIPGPRPGRVDFEFTATDGQTLRLNVEIARFRLEADGLTGSALYRLFLAPR